MQPALPGPDGPGVSFRKTRPGQDGAPGEPSASDPQYLSAEDVGSFEQGTAFSRWALARYLVGRVIGDSLSTSLLVVFGVLLMLAAASSWLLHSTFLAVLAVIAALLVLLVRGGVRLILRGLTAPAGQGPDEQRMRALLRDTHQDTLRELRRVGLPGRTLTLPLLAFRLLGKRRSATLERMRSFDLGRAVPAARIDELHMLLGAHPGRPVGPTGRSGTITP